MFGERSKLQVDEELDAGRDRAARALARRWDARARERLELEQAAGQRACAKLVWL